MKNLSRVCKKWKGINNKKFLTTYLILLSANISAYKFTYHNNTSAPVQATTYLSGLPNNPGIVTIDPNSTYTWDATGSLSGYCLESAYFKGPNWTNACNWATGGLGAACGAEITINSDGDIPWSHCPPINANWTARIYLSGGQQAIENFTFGETQTYGFDPCVKSQDQDTSYVGFKPKYYPSLDAYNNDTATPEIACMCKYVDGTFYGTCDDAHTHFVNNVDCSAIDCSSFYGGGSLPDKADGTGIEVHAAKDFLTQQITKLMLHAVFNNSSSGIIYELYDSNGKVVKTSNSDNTIHPGDWGAISDVDCTYGCSLKPINTSADYTINLFYPAAGTLVVKMNTNSTKLDKDNKPIPVQVVSTVKEGEVFKNGDTLYTAITITDNQLFVNKLTTWAPQLYYPGSNNNEAGRYESSEPYQMKIIECINLPNKEAQNGYLACYKSHPEYKEGSKELHDLKQYCCEQGNGGKWIGG